MLWRPSFRTQNHAALFAGTPVVGFPQVVSRTATSGAGANATSHTITLPTHASGDILVVLVGNDGTTGVTQTLDAGTSSAGWNNLGFISSASTSLCGCAVYWILCDSASENLTVTTSSGEMVSWVVYRITGGVSVDASSAGSASGGSANADPPSHTPSGGSNKYLWIVGGSWDGNVVVPTVAPTDFTNLTTVAHVSVAGASMGTAEREFEGSSLDPDAFTSAAEQWAVWTIAVSPT